MKTLAAAFALAVVAMAGSAGATTAPDFALIRNTGSTNFTGYTIKVWADGKATAVHSGRTGQALDQPASATLPKPMVDQFFRDLKTARGTKPAAQPCMKSASFGTATVIQYHGWTSPDLECPGDGAVIALGSDAKKIAAQLHLQGQPVRRIPMMPNEPRRGEPGPGQASATPEPAPSAS